jgi:hypothetical protein
VGLDLVRADHQEEGAGGEEQDLEAL